MWSQIKTHNVIVVITTRLQHKTTLFKKSDIVSSLQTLRVLSKLVTSSAVRQW